MLWMLCSKVADLPPQGGPIPEPTATQVGDFYVRVGMAIAAWQFVEASLFNIYASAVRSNQYASLGAAFHMPTSFRVRLDMTNEAVTHSDLAAPLKEEWNLIRERMAKKSGRRNKLIHGVVMFDPKRPQANQQLFIAPNVMNPAKRFDETDIIRQSDLEAMLQVFEALAAELEQFRRKLPTPVQA